MSCKMQMNRLSGGKHDSWSEDSRRGCSGGQVLHKRLTFLLQLVQHLIFHPVQRCCCSLCCKRHLQGKHPSLYLAECFSLAILLEEQCWQLEFRLCRRHSSTLLSEMPGEGGRSEGNKQIHLHLGSKQCLGGVIRSATIERQGIDQRGRERKVERPSS